MTHILYDLQIHSFVLMNNHYHLIASTPNSNIPDCMRRFSTNVSFRLTRLGNRINQTFSGRYFKSILTQPNHYLNTYKYNYRNPVESGLVSKVQDYPYSTLSGLLGGTKLGVPLLHDDTLFNDPTSTLDWLNSTPDETKLDAMVCGLRKQFFQSKKDTSNSPIIKRGELI